MSDFEYIIQQVKKFHYSGWNDEELRKCVDMLPGLTREQQVSLFRSKWIEHEKTPQMPQLQALATAASRSPKPFV